VLTILLFSGLGSAVVRSPRVHARAVFAMLVILCCAVAVVSPYINQAILGWSALWRTLVAVAGLAPLAFLMGMPFPLGLAWLERGSPPLVPWAWAVNGCASVLASVLAAILALSLGFTATLLIGAGSYAVAGALMWRQPGQNLAEPAGASATNREPGESEGASAPFRSMAQT
jgi:hypothetical protein